MIYHYLRYTLLLSLLLLCTQTISAQALITNPPDNSNFEAPANITVDVDVSNIGATENSYLRVVNSAQGWRKLKLSSNNNSIWFPNINVTSGGNNMLEITLKNISGFTNWNLVQIRPGAASSNPLNLGSYVAAVGGLDDTWKTITIPLADFHPSVNFTSLSYMEFPYCNGAGPFELGIQKIAFTGGATPYLWFGDDKTDNAHDGTGNGYQMLAEVVEGLSSGVEITKVELYLNNTLAAIDLLPPFSFQLTNLAIGDYDLKAIAYSADSIYTSAITQIHVTTPPPNQAPTVSITNPTNNSTITGTNLPISAAANDIDGNVVKVDFYEGSTLLGTDFTSNFGITWNNVPLGTYILTAVATDDDGDSTISAPITVTIDTPTVSAEALLVVGNISLNSGDQAVKAQLESLGFTVTVIGAVASTSADADGKGLVLISSTVNSTDIATKFTHVTVPVINWEQAVHDDLGMTGISGQSGSLYGETTLKIINDSHPLAAGLSNGNVAVYSGNDVLSWGKPAGDAIKIATSIGDPAKVVLFGYETGATMESMTAPARRVGLFLKDGSAALLTADGLALFDAAILWAANLNGPIPDDPNTPPTFNVSKDVTVDEDFVSTETVTINPDPVPAWEAGQVVTYHLLPPSVPFANVSINSGTGEITITAVANANGSQIFTVVADDGQAENNIASASFGLKVNSVNDVPTFSLSGNITVSENFGATETVTVTPDPVPADETGQTVNYTIVPTSVSFANVSINSNTGTVSITSVADSVGSELFTVWADDGQGVNNTATQNFTLTITADSLPANVAPTASITSPNDGDSFIEGSTVNVEVDATDDLAVTQVDLYVDSILNNSLFAEPFNFALAGLSSGSHGIYAIATDGGALSSSSDQIEITVLDSSTSEATIMVTNPTAGSKFYAPADITLNAVIDDPNNQKASTYLKVTNPDKGYRKLKLGYNASNLWNPKYDVTAGGNNSLEITLKDSLGTADWEFIQVRPQGASTDPISLLPYVTVVGGIGETWKTISIPLSDFHTGVDFTSLSYFEFPYCDNTDPFQICIQKIEFTGGTSPFVWFGDEKTDNIHDGDGSSGHLMAELAEDAGSGENIVLVDRVEFYEGTNLVGMDSTDPYSLEWLDVEPGNYNLTARAIYEDNSIIFSPVVDILVEELETLSDSIVITVTFDSAPTNLSVTKATLKYNKDFAFSWTLDDGYKDVMTEAFPLFNGGLIAGTGETAPGLFYTDGCGNDIPFRAGLAWHSKNGLDQDIHIGNVPDLMTWEDLSFLYDNGWDVLNHSLTHAANDSTIDYDFEVTENAAYIFAKTGIPVTQWVTPSGDHTYTQYAFDNGMKAVYDQATPGFLSPQLRVDGLVHDYEFKLNRHFLQEPFFDSTNIAVSLDEAAGLSVGGNHYWLNQATHRVGFHPYTGGSLHYPLFSYYMEYLENNYGKSGSDRMWMAPLQQVYEYIIMRDLSIMSTSVSGNQLEIVIDLSGVPADLRRYALSFNIESDQDFHTVEIDSIFGLSFDGAGSDKLINIEWEIPIVPPASKKGKVFEDLQEETRASRFSIYPNPVSNNTLYLAFEEELDEDMTITIHDLIGKKHLEKQVVLSGERKIKLELPQLGAGVYFVTTSSGALRETSKFIKK